ncbi:MAG: hypothetical protein K9N00_05950 [Candidatus Marinimicrobia bacterium]|nr:hypothetical protein [Candidatus Neomarinimicrobiota bacterium]
MSLNTAKYYSLFLIIFLAAGVNVARAQDNFAITGLRLDGEQDSGQCVSTLPTFIWDYSDKAVDYRIKIKLLARRDKRDSLLVGETFKETSRKYFDTPSQNELVPGQSYRLVIEARHPDQGWSEPDTLDFTINTPPQASRFFNQQSTVFTSDSVHFRFQASQDRQISRAKLSYRIKIRNESRHALVTDTLFQTTSQSDTFQISMVRKWQENGQFTATVQASDGVSFSKADSLQFFVNRRNDPPLSFNLIPVEDTLAITKVDLEWKAAWDAEAEFGGSIDNYYVEIATDSAFQRTVINKKISAKQTRYNFSEIENHRLYFWRIVAVDDHGDRRESKQVEKIIANTGNHPPQPASLLTPSNEEILKPQDFIIWHQPRDKDKHDKISFKVEIADYSGTETLASFTITQKLLEKALNEKMDWLNYNYQNIIRLQLVNIINEPNRLQEGAYYRVIIHSFDGWGGEAINNSQKAVFQYDDNINNPPQPPSIGLNPDSSVINSAPVIFRWYPATDPDINDHIMYQVMISRRPDFSGSNYITRTTEMSANRLALDRKLMENRKYYWRVKSIDMHGAESAWSQRHCFYINFINEAPDKPVEYLSPENWSELNNSTVFRWKLAHDPDPGEELDYILDIDNDKYFQSIDLRHRIDKKNLVIDQESQTAIFEFGQIDSTGLKENELYYWRIAAVDQKGLKSPFYRNYPRLNYNTHNDPPQPVQKYINIKSGGMVSTQTPVLRWKAARDPDFMDFGRTLQYTVQISRSPDFSTYDLFSYQSKKGANSVKITKKLDENKKWFFRIQTVDSKGANSEWSRVDSFVVNAKSEAPQQVNKGFVLRNNMTTDTREPKLSWRPVDDYDPHHDPDDLYYLVKYCPARYFGTRKESKKSETIKSRAGRTSIVLPELDENQSYIYRVAAVDLEGKRSEWSPPQQFIVNSNQEPPRPFALISPANGTDSVETDVSFKWRRSSDPDPESSLEYSIMISTDSLFRRNVIENRIASSEGDTIEYIPASPLKSASKYFWKVEAEDNTGLSTAMPPGENNAYMFTTIGFKEYLNVGKKSRLLQNSPNPFHNVTRISYYVGSYTNVRIMVFNVLGEKVDVLVNEKMKAGQYEVTWDGTNQDGQPMPGGMYFCRMATPRNNDLIKMIMLR